MTWPLDQPVPATASAPCWKLPPEEAAPRRAVVVRPSKSRRRMMLATPATASEPYWAEAPSGTISSRSTAATGIAEMSKIGRASCRERVCPYVYISGVAVSLKKKDKNKQYSYKHKKNQRNRSD